MFKRYFSIGFLISLPALTGLFVFVLLPFVLAVILSFTNLRMGSPLALEFVGIELYERLWSDAVFHRAILNNMLFAIVVVPVQTSIALGLALLLNRPLRGMTLFRTCFFMPVVFPLSLVAVIWILIYAPGSQGIMNHVFTVLLPFWTNEDFLHHPSYALPAIMLTSIWQGAGFQMVILLAGLQAIPHKLYEAAAVDGAGQWSQFWHITLPQLRHTLLFVMLVTTILAFRLFDQVAIMTQGGPNHATTTVMFEAIQAAFSRQQIAKGSAMTVILFLIVLFLTVLQRRLSQQKP